MDQPERISPEKAAAALLDVAKQDRQIQADINKELFKSAITSGENAIKAAMLINAGASVAVLAFLGNLVSKAPHVKLGEFPTAMLCFVAGVLVTAIASGFTYFTQHCYNHGRKKTGDVTNMLAIAFVSSSYFLFALGGWIAFQEFQLMK